MSEKKIYPVTQSRPIRAKDEKTGKERVFSIKNYANRKGGSTTSFGANGKPHAVRPFGTILEVHPLADKKRLAKLKIALPAPVGKPNTGNKDADKTIQNEQLNAAQANLVKAKAELKEAKKTKDDAIIGKAQIKVDTRQNLVNAAKESLKTK